MCLLGDAIAYIKMRRVLKCALDGRYYFNSISKYKVV